MVAAERIEPDPEPVDLGLALVKSGCLSEADHKRVLRMQAAQPEAGSLVHLLNRLGLVAERDIATQLAQLLDLPLIAGEDFPAEPLLAERLSFRFLKECRALPLELVDGELRVAMADPQDAFVLAALRLASGCRISPRVALGSEIDAAIERMHGQGQSQMGGILARVESNEQDEVADVEQLRDRASEAPVIRLVNLIIQRAVELRASDIHIEPFESRLKVRYRVDGLLQETEAPPVQLSPAVISRVKLMARLNIAERRLPQDGRIEMRVQGSDLDIRVSTVPTMHGESVVMRLLNRENVVLDFAALGFGEQPLARLQAALRIPHGVLLVTGPTGSGKTTTLYAMLQHTATPSKNYVTLEDPVEYYLDAAGQVLIREKIGLTFPLVLRSILRQDPDVILLGEIRDIETAEVAFHAALTGHQVFSTLHTNSAVATIARLFDLGLKPYVIATALEGIIAQRLVRRICEHCREPVAADPAVISRLGSLFADKNLRHFRGKGCSRCAHTGYLGRVGVYEVLWPDERLRELIASGSSMLEMTAVARESGTRNLLEDAREKVHAGLTTAEEVLRVLGAQK